MRHFLILTLFLAYNTCYSQCTTKKDAFTGKTTRVATIFLAPVSMTFNQVLNFTKADNIHKISFLVTMPSFNRDLKIENASLILKLQNDSIFKFKPVLGSKIQIIEGQQPAQNIFIESPISLDQLNIFSTNKVEAIRIGLDGDNGMDIYGITEKHRKNIVNAAGCIK